VSISSSDRSITWALDDTANADIQYLYVGQLKDPSKVPPGVLAALQRNGIKPTDFPDIMSADPFADGSMPTGSERFVSLHTTFPYEPPFAPADPIPTYTFALDNSTVKTEGHSSTHDYQVGVTAGGTASFWEIYKTTVKASASWTWSNTRTEDATTGMTQSASVTIGGPSFGYTGPTDMVVYYDILYQTFAFAPVQGVQRLRGTVVSDSGKPVAGQEVIAVANGIKYRTFTNAAGKYRFFDRMSGPVDLQAGNVSQQLENTRSNRIANIVLKQ